MGISRFRRKTIHVARQAGDPVDAPLKPRRTASGWPSRQHRFMYPLTPRRLPKRRYRLKTLERRASDTIDGTGQILVDQRAGGSLAQDTVRLLVGSVLRPVICRRVNTPTYTHWYEFTELE